MDRRLINHFVSGGLLSRQDMQRIILRASKDKISVVSKLLDENFVTDEVMAQHLAQFYDSKLLNLSMLHVDVEALKLLMPKVAQTGGVLPFMFSDDKNCVHVAVYDLELAQSVMELLQSSTGSPPEPHIAPRRWVIEGIQHYYLNQPSDMFGRDANSSWMRRSTVPEVSANLTHSGLLRHKTMDPSLSRHELRASFVGHTSRPGQTSSIRGDFDDFLGELSSSGPMIDPNLSTLPHADSSNFWSDNNLSTDGFGNPKTPDPSGFDIFEHDLSITKRPGVTIQDMVATHHEKLRKLKEEDKRQRQVIQVLVDMLVEARVISKRELTKRLKDLRRND